MKAIHMLIERVLKVRTALRELLKNKEVTIDDDEARKVRETQEELETSENCINLLMQNSTCDYECEDELGLTTFHVACTLTDGSAARNILESVTYVNRAIRQDSSFCAGYTALHFAAQCNVGIVVMLVQKGANMLMEDAAGITPLDMCIRCYNLSSIEVIFSNVPKWQNISFSECNIKIIDYIRTLQNFATHEELLHRLRKHNVVRIDEASPLWPGYTILHIAVILLPEQDLQMLQDILSVSAEAISVQGCDGSTPAHLAILSDKRTFAEYLLTNVKTKVNCANSSNLSLMHIASAVNDQVAMKRLLANKDNNVNVAYKGKPFAAMSPGWTPLHVAVHTNHMVIARALLASGADLLQRDDAGYTCVHLLLGTSGASKLAKSLLCSDRLEERVVENVGLTHLHVASYFNDCEAIRRLLNAGSDVRATIDKCAEERLRMFVGCTPLHLVSVEEAMCELVQRGADVLAMTAKGFSPLCSALDPSRATLFSQQLNFFVEFVERSGEQFEARMKSHLGLTRLHVACRMLDVAKVEALLSNGVDDISTRVTERSATWPGYTALHALARTSGLNRSKARKNVCVDLIRTLSSRGADVARVDKSGDTPVHVALNAESPRYGVDLAKVLLEQYRDYDKNPVDRHGIAFFHVACLTLSVDAVEQWLMRGHVDVDLQVKSSSSRFGKRTALMMALSAETKRAIDVKTQLRLVDLLVRHGADVHAVDAHGWTPLHYVAAKCGFKRMDLLARVVRPDTNMNERNNDGQTAFELLLRRRTSFEEITWFIQRGSRVNDNNVVTGEGYIGIATCSNKAHRAEVLRAMLSGPDILELDEYGRNAIHNAVACVTIIRNDESQEEFYFDLIEGLMRRGCNVDHKDERGRTALHLAAKFDNVAAVAALLTCGADVNAEDSTGMSPLAACLGVERVKCQRAISLLYVYLRVMDYFKLWLSRENKNSLRQVAQWEALRHTTTFDESAFIREIEKTKTMEVGRFVLYDILRESTEMHESLSSVAAREAMELPLEQVNCRQFPHLKYMVMAQCKKLSRRLPLIGPAADAFQTLWPLPHVCINAIIKFLDNSSLKNLCDIQ